MCRCLSWGTFACTQHQVYVAFSQSWWLLASSGERSSGSCLSYIIWHVSYTIKIRYRLMLQDFSKLACISSWIKSLPGYMGCFPDCECKWKIASEHHLQHPVSSRSHLTPCVLPGQHSKMSITLTCLGLASICLSHLCFEALKDIPLPPDSPNGKVVLDFRQAQPPEMAVAFFFYSKMSVFATIMTIFFYASSVQNTGIRENTNWFRRTRCPQPHSDTSARQWMLRCLARFTSKIQSIFLVWF